jgi:hypothetical protein
VTDRKRGTFGHAPTRKDSPAYEDRGGHSPKAKTVDVKQVVSELPKGPAPAASKKADSERK